MEFLKKQKVLGFVANVIVAVMAIITFTIYVQNVTAEYYMDMNTDVLVMMICAIVFIVAAIILPAIAKGKFIKLAGDVFRVAASILIIMSGVTFIGMRVESFGYIFASNLELGNEAAFSAGSQAIIGIVLFVVTWLFSAIASFFEIGKRKA